MESLRGKQIGRRNLVITGIAELENAAACHVLFVSASEEDRLVPILDAVSGLPVLTVADIDKFASAGGIVGLTEVDDRSRLEVNIGAANRAGVKLSSKLLRLAETVDSQAARLESLSPLAVLGRGYSITQDGESGQVIRAAAKLRVGQKIVTRFVDGEAMSEVKSTGDV